jgi:hypothetical protein
VSSDAQTSATFTLRILPSNATIESAIIPLFDSLKSVVIELESSLAELESKGINTTSMRQLLSDIKGKLNQTATSIEKSNYFEASQLLDNAKILVDELKSSIEKAKNPGIDIVLILVIVIVIAAVCVFIYLMLPTEEGFSLRTGWKTSKEDSIMNKILEKLKQKKEKHEPT